MVMRALTIPITSIAHSATTGQTDDDHHDRVHTVLSHDTDATGANLNTLTDGSDGNPLHGHNVKIKDESRTAAAASGDVSYTGAGFPPSGVDIIAIANNESFNIGHGDTDLDEVTGEIAGGGASHFVSFRTTMLIRGTELDGTDAQDAVLKSRDSDGITVTWTKRANGKAVDFAIVYRR